jgi:hypothetical protein
MTAYPSVERTSSPKSASASGVSLQNGLTSDEARRRLEKFGPNAMPDTALHPLRMALEKFWAPIPWMFDDRTPTNAWRLSRSHDRWSSCIQRCAWAVPGKPRTGHLGCAEVAACTECIRPARRRLEDHTGSPPGPRRRGEAFTRTRGCRRRASHGRRNPARPIHAHRGIRTHRSRRRRSQLSKTTPWEE